MDSARPLEVIILAAGEGKRMKSRLPKVLHKLAGTTLLEHVIAVARELHPGAIHVVIGHGEEQVRTAVAGADLNWVTQTQRLGTGHAVMQALPGVGKDSRVLVLCGDVPLLKADSVRPLLDVTGDGLAVMTAVVSDPAGLGRIVRDSDGAITAVVEHRDASPAQLEIREINTGVIAATASGLRRWLPLVGSDNDQGEYYLPDIIAPALVEGTVIQSSHPGSLWEIQGINDRNQLSRLERTFQAEQAAAMMASGVTLADPARLDVRGILSCGEDVFIDVNVVFSGDVTLENGVHIGPNCVISDSHIGAGAIIHPQSVLENAEVGVDCSVGPFARLRPGTVLGEGARVGNFVETKKARIGNRSKVNHLSYVGDCDMGVGVNVGAGTITCNYDGVNKHKTEIGDGVFVGSNSTLVAPVQIEDGGFVAAGTTLTKPVPRHNLAVSRAKQRNIENWQRPGVDKKEAE